MFSAEKPPYSLDALEPYLSKESMDYHYNKHHKGYANKLNQLVKGTRYAGMDLEEVIIQTGWVHGPESYRTGHSQEGRAQYVRDLNIYNNAAQVWNHNFFWKCMSPDGGGEPSGKLGGAIKREFGHFGSFREEFSQVAADQFGSGWVWLLFDGELVVERYDNAISPLSFEYPPKENILLCLDVWEHAYYLTYKNNKTEYIKTFLDHLVNWEYVEERFNSIKEPS